ncbi:hypothetical protein ACH5RR_016098 [Cinchona calisaya]|uniref:Uncharacterized protein n=1 Tax=Cinchona calisaya TaxID=153742 RepID=A0ABD2ZVX7_9GENT
METQETPSLDIVCVKNNDPADDLQVSYVNQSLEAIMQKLTQQMTVITVAFLFLGIILFRSIVQPTIPLRSKWWIPFCIFLSVSIIYWCTIERIIRVYNRVRQEYNSTLSLVLNNGSISAGNEMNWMETSWFASFHILYRQNRYLFVLLSFMMSFTSLILYACYSILHD